jgi:hypothetical protein
VEDLRRELENSKQQCKQSLDEKVAMQNFIMKKEDEILALKNELTDTLNNQ